MVIAAARPVKALRIFTDTWAAAVKEDRARGSLRYRTRENGFECRRKRWPHVCPSSPVVENVRPSQ